MRALKASSKKQSRQTRSLIDTAKRVLKIESDSIKSLIPRIDDHFAEVVHALKDCPGHVVVTGMGKSGLIGKKIASTLSSIGLPALFLHAAEGVHGDLGMISKKDIVIALSNSGETDEILRLLPPLNRLKCTLIAITGNPKSTLAKRSNFVLNTAVREEACLKGLIPTASTTAALAMGDALVMAYLDLCGFREEDFAFNHPGGSLGRKLLTTVEDLMHGGQDIPKVLEDADIYEVLKEMTGKRMGTTFVVNKKGNLKGIITDGDLRRTIEKKKHVSDCTAREVMSANPKVIGREDLATKALQIMEEYSITSLAVSENRKSLDGIIHMHDLLKAGIA